MEKIVRVWSLEIPSSYALQVILFHGVIELEDTVETISNSFSTCFSLWLFQTSKLQRLLLGWRRHFASFVERALFRSWYLDSPLLAKQNLDHVLNVGFASVGA